ncbi:glycosyltransferase [Pedobacter sp. Leaf170]|uniref:glycosyltransferase n=1 Tax=Pedobacter sp. Leaf170 TaxID=2876558 RepID=UPI001E37A5F4|nr:glycosyltransferase [Pedobacter sp. Leaf170]
MPYNFAFYVHHHGSGHLMRAIAIAETLKDCNLTFMGSGLAAKRKLIPTHITIVDLPFDFENKPEVKEEDEIYGLHYAPLNINGQRSRVALMADLFANTYPLLLIVDVSVEVVMLARLSGVPTIIVRQHGKRTDLPHEIAYRNALGLIAPYHVKMNGSESTWLTSKTFFAGGLSRFKPEPDKSINDERKVGILIGSGGTSINLALLKHIANMCPDWNFQVLGKLEDIAINCKNLIFHGDVLDPRIILRGCCIVIGNAGHNTVMEMGALNKRLILIPEKRPFDEQLEKAQIVEQLGLAEIVLPELCFKVDWNKILLNLLPNQRNWAPLIDTNAAEKAGKYIKVSYQNFFNLFKR